MRLATLSLIAACAVTFPAAASASPKLPPSANKPPVLPEWVIPAEAPVETSAAQAPSAAGPIRGSGAASAAKTDVDDLRPWATVNICDTANLPNALGVRAGMPGTGHRQLMFMRFTAQYWSPSANEWVEVPGNGKSRWVFAGSARYATQQTGWTFTFEQPPVGTTFVMRAIVEQEWRGPDGATGAKRKHSGANHRRAHKRKRVMMQRFKPASRKVVSRVSRRSDPRARWAVAKERTLLTETGLTGVDGGDPAGTSKAMCLIW